MIRNKQIAVSVFFLPVFMIAFGNAHSQTPDNMYVSSLDSLFHNYFLPDKPGGAVLVVKDGMIVYQKGFGIADTKTKEKNNHCFRNL